MRLEESRRFFYLSDVGDVNKDALEAQDAVLLDKDGRLQMPRDTADNRQNRSPVRFDSIGDGLEYLNKMGVIKMRAEQVENMVTLQLGARVPVEVEKGAKISATDMEKIRSQMTDPDYFEPEEIHSLNFTIINNIADRRRERVPVSLIRQYSKNLVGKVLSVDHDPKQRLGKFYSSSVVKIAEEELKEIIAGYTWKDIKKILDAIEERDGGYYKLMGKAFFLGGNLEKEKERVRKIMAGIDSWISIQATASPYEIVKDPKENLLFFEYQTSEERKGEVYEVSFVYLGEVFQTKISKEVGSENIPPFYKQSFVDQEYIDEPEQLRIVKAIDKMLLEGSPVVRIDDPADQKDYEVTFNKKLKVGSSHINLYELRARVLARSRAEETQEVLEKMNLIKAEEKQRRDNMRLVIKSLGIEKEIDPEKLTDDSLALLARDIEDQLAKSVAEAMKGKVDVWGVFGDSITSDRLNVLKKAVDAINDKIGLDLFEAGAIEKLEEIKKSAEALITRDVDEIIEKSRLLDLVKAEDVETEKETWKKAAAPERQAHLDSIRKQHSEKFKYQAITDQGNGKTKSEEKAQLMTFDSLV